MVLYADGTYGKITNNHIQDNSLSLTKINFNTDLNVNNNKIINVSNPTNNNDAVNKSYVDNKILSNGDGTKYLSDDGSYKIVSGGSGGGTTYNSLSEQLTTIQSTSLGTNQLGN